MITRLLYLPQFILSVIRLSWFVTKLYFKGDTTGLMAMSVTIQAIKNRLNVVILDDEDLDRFIKRMNVGRDPDKAFKVLNDDNEEG